MATRRQSLLGAAHQLCVCTVPVTRLTAEEISKWTSKPVKLEAGDSPECSGGEDSTEKDDYHTGSETEEDEQFAVKVKAEAEADDDVEDKSNLKRYAAEYEEDEVYTIDLKRPPHRQRRSSQECPIPAKLLEKFNQRKRKSALTIPLFCLFCLKEFHNVDHALLCYYRQTKHFPLRCVKCEEVTLTTDDIIQHYRTAHPKINSVQYKRSHAPAKERWIKKFISYQIECILNQAVMIPNSILHKYCPVCNQYDYKLGETSNPKPKHKFFPVLDKNHIHKHLKYHPFQCSLCLKQGKRFDLTIVNSKAKDHLKQHHNISHPSEDDLKNNFEPLGLIPELERYINSYARIIEGSNDSSEVKISPPSNKPAITTTTTATISSSSSSKKRSVSVKSSTPNSVKKKKLSSPNYSLNDFYYPSLKTPKKEGSKNCNRKNGKRLSDAMRSPRGDSRDDETVIDLDAFYGDPVNTSFGCKQENDLQIVCIFCTEKFTDVLAAWDHYANHLDYRPITCQLCQKSFPGPKAFQFHGSEHVDYVNLPYTWNHDELIETWCREFLHAISKDFEAKPEFSAFCPVCRRKFSKSEGRLKLDPLVIRKHIYSHLKYQPYECSVCVGEKVYIHDLETDAIDHLAYHQITCSRQEVATHFIKSRGIKAIDKYLDLHFDKIMLLLDSPSLNHLDDSAMSITSSTSMVNGSSEQLCDVETLFNSLEQTLCQNAIDTLLGTVKQEYDEMPCEPQPSFISLGPVKQEYDSMTDEQQPTVTTTTNESNDIISTTSTNDVTNTLGDT